MRKSLIIIILTALLIIICIWSACAQTKTSIQTSASASGSRQPASVSASTVAPKTNFLVTNIPDRRQIKQFSDSSGNVFGTCYDPRTGKDLNSILGPKLSGVFASAIKASKVGAHKSHQGHSRVQVVKNENIYIRSTRMGRSLKICVCDPTLAPEGVSCNEIN